MYSPRFFGTAAMGFLLSVLLSLCSLKLRAQTYEYPFQNPNLSEEERVSNLVSLITGKVKKIAVVGNRAEDVFKDWYGALPAYSVSPLDGIRKAVEGSDVEVRFQRWDSDGDAAKLAAWADLVIVCVGNDPNTSPQWGDNTVQSPWGAGTIAGEGREALDRRSLQQFPICN